MTQPTDIDALIARLEAAKPSIWEEIPHVRKAGRYLFFGLCAFGVSILAYGVCVSWIGKGDFAKLTSNAVMFVSFMALREMSKQWDAVLRAHALALRAKQEQSS